LYAATPQGLVPVQRFRAGLFFEILAAAGTVKTLKGNDIVVSGPLFPEMTNQSNLT
jgi:hypothetical protein